MTQDEGDPIGYKLLARGTPVVTAEGERFGEVARVLDNEREHIFDGIVVRTPEGRRVFVDAPEVAQIAERRVTLTIGAEQAAGLPPWRGLRGRLEDAGRRRAVRWKRRLGR